MQFSLPCLYTEACRVAAPGTDASSFLHEGNNVFMYIYTPMNTREIYLYILSNVFFFSRILYNLSSKSFCLFLFPKRRKNERKSQAGWSLYLISAVSAAVWEGEAWARSCFRRSTTTASFARIDAAPVD